MAAEKLVKLRDENIRVSEGGRKKWKGAGLTVEEA